MGDDRILHLMIGSWQSWVISTFKGYAPSQESTKILHHIVGDQVPLPGYPYPTCSSYTFAKEIVSYNFIPLPLTKRYSSLDLFEGVESNNIVT